MTNIFTKSMIGGLLMASTIITATPAAAQNRDGDRGDYRRERTEDRREYQRESRENVRDYRQEQRRDTRDYRQDRREDNRDWRNNDNNNRGGNSWNNNWRNDNRYNWQSYRNQYRDRYRVTRYVSPYRNNGYSRFRIGVNINSGYYGSRYWIRDPWHYRLPTVPSYMRWVRYYNDVVLVDVRTGRVRDVIHNFFW